MSTSSIDLMFWIRQTIKFSCPEARNGVRGRPGHFFEKIAICSHAGFCPQSSLADWRDEDGDQEFTEEELIENVFSCRSVVFGDYLPQLTGLICRDSATKSDASQLPSCSRRSCSPLHPALFCFRSRRGILFSFGRFCSPF